MMRSFVSSDLKDCSETYSRAYANDPSVNVYFKNNYLKTSPLKTLCELQLKSAERIVVTDNNLGFAMWNSPNFKEAISLRKIFLMLKIVNAVGTNLPLAIASMSAAQKARPKQPHYYLLNMCVDPAVQGKGVGTKLLDEGLKKCDELKLPCYLEIANPNNQKFYERFGFKVITDITNFPGLPQVKGMWRNPAPNRSTFIHRSAPRDFE